MSKKSVDRFVAANGIEVDDHSADRSELDVTLWSPAGRVWVATGCHTLSICWYSERTEAWRELWSDVKLGLEACDQPGCEICAGGGPIEEPAPKPFTKTETLRRLRVLARLSREAGGHHTGMRIEVGHRVLGPQYADNPEDALARAYPEDDDLSYHDDLKGAARDAQYQTPGGTVHLYISDPGDGVDYGELHDVNCGWLGTHDREPVLLDVNGTPVVRR